MGWPRDRISLLVVGLAAGWLHPLRWSVSRPFGRLWAAGLAGMVAALVAVTVTVGLAARR